MGDILIAHNLRLTYGTFTSYGRNMEHSHFRGDVQVTPSPWKIVRTPRTNKAQTTTT